MSLSSCRTCNASLGILGLLLLAGCAAGPEPANETARIRLRPLSGLERVEVPIPGVLELRPGHRIGGYDALLIRDGRLDYRHGSMRLTPEAEDIFLDLLQGSLVSAIEAAEIGMTDTPDRCAMQIEFDVHEMDLDTSDYSPELADMVVAMTFRDSRTGDALLRYARRAVVEHPAAGVSDDRQLRVGLYRVVHDMDVTNVLRPAGLATDEGIEGCRGVLADRGRAAEAN